MFIIINGNGTIINKPENIEYVQDGIKVGETIYVDIEVRAINFNGECNIGDTYDNGVIIPPVKETLEITE